MAILFTHRWGSHFYPTMFKSIMAQKEVGKVAMLDVLRTDGLTKLEVKPRDWPQ